MEDLHRLDLHRLVQELVAAEGLRDHTAVEDLHRLVQELVVAEGLRDHKSCDRVRAAPAYASEVHRRHLS